jgi:alpha-glucosidase
VIYQIYPRSFADASGDGIGDLPGVTAHLDDLRALGVDAVWLSPFYRSPQKDAGYDVADYRDVDPLFGTLADFDEMLGGARARHPRDRRPRAQPLLRPARLVPGGAGRSPGSAARARYLFRDGKGENGELPPNNWESVFGGPAWTRVTEADGTPGQWYLHLFDTSQPDFDWANPEVQEEFRGILRFWLDRGVDGFRVDVAHGLVKTDGCPTTCPRSTPTAWAAPTTTCRTGVRTACTRSTATGTACSPSTTATGRCAPRRGCRPSTAPPSGCAPTRCTRRSTSRTS